MPQAIDLSLATPMINPFLPFIKLIDYTFSNANVAFVPPKPKLLDIIEFRVTSVSVLVMIGNFLVHTYFSTKYSSEMHKNYTPKFEENSSPQRVDLPLLKQFIQKNNFLT